MFPGLAKVWGVVGGHPIFTLTTTALTTLLTVFWGQRRGQASERARERRSREELEAYACLDPRFEIEDRARFGLHISQVIAKKSPFYRAALLLREADGRLAVVGSTGIEPPVLDAINQWASRIAEPIHVDGVAHGSIRSTLGRGIEVGSRSLAIVLDEEQGRAIVVPFANTSNRRLMGAIVVCADGMLSVPRKLVDPALRPLEILSVKLGRSMENAILSERLIRTERLAGLGLLAGGVAHALNNPLTAVLGYAELISESASHPRVRQDAQTILSEARRMRDTVDGLLNLWRPPVHRDEAVDVKELIHELAKTCSPKLGARGVELVLQTADNIPAVRGNRDRLRQVMEHLLNNAAQAIATRTSPTHSIRITVTHHVSMVQLIVSDTGPGFREPGRAFDPFYTTRDPGEGAGLGLSICYRIVREHNGNISAFNLHPNGAAVMIELPIGSPDSVFPESFIQEVA
jgi:signal transduction histidine kinase